MKGKRLPWSSAVLTLGLQITDRPTSTFFLKSYIYILNIFRIQTLYLEYKYILVNMFD